MIGSGDFGQVIYAVLRKRVEQPQPAETSSQSETDSGLDSVIYSGSGGLAESGKGGRSDKVLGSTGIFFKI